MGAVKGSSKQNRARKPKARPSGRKKQIKTQVEEDVVDAKWNNVIDRLSVRMLLLAVGFGVWLAISYGVLAS
jgi:hypothetical protein